MDFYENKHFINPDGTFYSKMIAPDVQAFALEKYGFKYQNKTTQQLVGGGYCIHNKKLCKWNKECRQKLLCNPRLLFKLEKLFCIWKSKNEN